MGDVTVPARVVRSVWLMLALALLTGCGAPPTAISTPTAPVPSTQESYQSDAAHGRTVDCAASATVKAWIDADSDGEPEEGELPLPGVRAFSEHSSATTDLSGVTGVWTGMTGCPPPTLSVSTDVPLGFRRTTPAVQEVYDRGVAWFGFAYLETVPTFTPMPNVSCAPVDDPSLAAERVTEIKLAPDGGVWALSPKGQDLARFAPESGTWTHYLITGTLPHVSTIGLASNGMLWAAGEKGLWAFDGTAWAMDTSGVGEVITDAWDLEPAPDGSLWIVANYRLTHYDPMAAKWTTYGAGTELNGRKVADVAVSPEGEVWAVADDSLYGFRMGSYTSDRPFAIARNSGARFVSAAPDGTVWFADKDNLTRFDPQTTQQIDWSSRWWGNDPNKTESAMALATAPDGSAWVGTTAGLYVFRGDCCQVFDVADGLPDNLVLAILVAPGGTAWVATKAGLAQCRVL